jgi:hypothetical protein
MTDINDLLLDRARRKGARFGHHPNPKETSR